MKYLNLFETFEYKDLTPKDVEPYHMHVHQTQFDIGSKCLNANVDDIITVYNSDDDPNNKDETVKKLRRIALLTGESGNNEKLELYDPDDNTVELGSFTYRTINLNGFNVVRLAWHDASYDGVNIWGYMIEKKYLKFVKLFSVNMFKDYSMQELIELYDDLDGDVSQFNKLTESYSQRQMQGGSVTMDTMVYHKAKENGMSEEVGVFFEYDTHYDSFNVFYYDNQDKYKEIKSIDEELHHTNNFNYQLKMKIFNYENLEYAKGRVVTFKDDIEFANFTFIVSDSHGVSMAIDHEIPLEYVESFMTLTTFADRDIFKRLCKAGVTEVLDDFKKGDMDLDELKLVAKMI